MSKTIFQENANMSKQEFSANKLYFVQHYMSVKQKTHITSNTIVQEENQSVYHPKLYFKEDDESLYVQTKYSPQKKFVCPILYFKEIQSLCRKPHFNKKWKILPKHKFQQNMNFYN